jgi:hypothetical protein
VGAAPVTASFFSFAPHMVARAVPDVWQRAVPDDVLRARVTGAGAAVARLTAGQPADAVAEAADLLADAAAKADHAGRVLGAANAALPTPADPCARLWHAATILREHRGDGHVATLVADGLSGCEVLAWRAAHDLERDVLQPARGWSDGEWQAAAASLVERGWLGADGRPTGEGLAAHHAREEATDRAAAAPWRGVDIGRVREVLTPIAAACRAAMPPINPIGLPGQPS